MMNKNHLTAVLCLVAATATAQLKTDINSGWKFAQSDDTATWQNVDLPHDWSIYSLPHSDAPSGNDGGYYDAGVGWYKKIVNPGKIADGERVMIDFEGVYQKATVYVNGKRAAWHGYGYTPFSVDVTPFLKPNADNVLTVRVDNSEQKNCRWYSGSGIYRNVWLRKVPAVSVQPQNFKILANADGHISIEALVENNMAERKTVNVKVLAADANAEKQVEIDGKSAAKVELEISVKNPKTWSVDNPNVYESSVFVDGVKNLTRKFGFRSISYDAQNGFALNNQNILVNGACVHHDNGLLGAAAPDAAEYHKVKLMKAAGFNLLRTSHNPPTEAFLDACDQLGMMVIDEAFDGWRTSKTDYDYSQMFDSLAIDDIKSMVVRDRHHPCIVAWSIGNEVIERKDIRVVHTAKMLKNAILSVDSSRPVTEALCAWDRDWEIYDPHADVLDIVGYNYMIFKHKSDHERCPERVIWQTESYPADAWRNYEIVAQNQYVIGDIVWTGLDYLGESGIGLWRYSSWPQGEHWQNTQFPAHGAYCGDVDITGFRKPISYYRDIIWNGSRAAETIHLSVCEPNGYTDSIKTTAWSTWPTWDCWNWPGWEGRPIDVEVYAAGKNVKLYLNDQLVGEQAVKQCKATFTINYQPGTLRAECDGKSSTLKTAAAPAKLALKPDRTQYATDRNDVAFIDITLTDKAGNPCAMSADEISVTVVGGELLAFGTADLRDNTNIHDTNHRLFHGRAQAIVRLPKGNKPVTLTAKGKGIAAATVRLK